MWECLVFMKIIALMILNVRPCSLLEGTDVSEICRRRLPLQVELIYPKSGDVIYL
jgi:hypothetical protein